MNGSLNRTQSSIINNNAKKTTSSPVRTGQSSLGGGDLSTTMISEVSFSNTNGRKGSVKGSPVR